MPELADLLGSAAGALTTAAFVPQAVKTWKSRSTGDLSLGMFLVFALGVLLWLCYGIIISSTPIIVANSVTLALALSILLMKLRFK
jgi:MtN3 and saliva related transmembrane protein